MTDEQPTIFQAEKPMRKIARSALSYTMLKFAPRFPCLVVSLIAIVFIIGRISLGFCSPPPGGSPSFFSEKSFSTGSYPQFKPPISDYKRQTYGNRNQSTLLRQPYLRPTDRLYAQNTQSGDYHPPTPAYSIQSAATAPVVTTGTASSVTYSSAR